MGIEEREKQRVANLIGRKKREEAEEERRGLTDEASIIASRRTIPKWVKDIRGEDMSKKYLQPPITMKDALNMMDVEGARGIGLRKIAVKAEHFDKVRDGVMLRSFQVLEVIPDTHISFSPQLIVAYTYN